MKFRNHSLGKPSYMGLSYCLSHDSDFSGGRLSCDHEEENEHFSEIFNCFKNDQVQNSYQNVLWNRENKRFFALVSKKVLGSSSLCPPSASLVYGKWKMPPLRRSAIARAFTSAVQFKMHAPTTLPPWQVPWGSEMADGFLQTTKPTTIIILAERSNLNFTRKRRNC